MVQFEASVHVCRVPPFEEVDVRGHISHAATADMPVRITLVRRRVMMRQAARVGCAPVSVLWLLVFGAWQGPSLSQEIHLQAEACLMQQMHFKYPVL